ncbi:MAG: RagB/SusD family nutrient uptake outer membrane protein [Candidatus Symbiothrix sp.]|jgi:hypothetical protein|nr:RagB/SusD family nutrient uptake outer membrane protein [Candidatus Symbiothrix sp.]
MKKHPFLIISFLFCFSLLMSFPACNNFESEPLNWVTEERVLDPADSTENSAIIRLFYATYLNLPTLHTRIDNSYLDAATDDALPTKGTALDNYRNGLLSAGNIAGLDGSAWSSNYTGIRRVNLFLEKVQLFPSSTQIPLPRMEQMKAEARLLRAYYYFELLKRWGGVPLLYDKVLNEGSDVHIPRNTIEDVAHYIISEISSDSTTYPQTCYYSLHAAQSTSAADVGEIGHVNQGVALALLSRLKLYLASDLYNENKDINKWKEAAEAAKELIDLGVYALYNGSDQTKLFAMIASEFPNREMIMVKEATANNNLEVSNSPIGFVLGSTRMNGATSPSQNLVDAFLTSTGKSIFVNYDPAQGIDPASNYNDQSPYTNRDPRLGRTIFTHGSRWMRRSLELFVGGANNGAELGTTYTRTGYYLKKFLGNYDMSNSTSYDALHHHYQIFRYAEILLNYAEAVNESDPTNDTEITFGLIELRKRAGITPGVDQRYGLPAAGSYSQELMRRIIRNERRIELAFEEHRFWDIRRWKICAAGDGDAVMTQAIKGVRITRQENGRFVFAYPTIREGGIFAPHMYWYPIPRFELLGNKNLKQNQGWSY